MSGESSSDPFPVALNASVTGWSAGTIGATSVTQLSMDGRVWADGFLALNPIVGGHLDTSGGYGGAEFQCFFHEMWVWGNPGGTVSLKVRNLHQIFNSGAQGKEIDNSHRIDTGNGVTRPCLHYVWPEDEQRIPIIASVHKTTSGDIKEECDGPPIAYWEATAPELGTTTIQKAQFYIRMTMKSNQLVTILSAFHVPGVKSVRKYHQEEEAYNQKRVKIAKVKAVTMPVLNE